MSALQGWGGVRRWHLMRVISVRRLISCRPLVLSAVWPLHHGGTQAGHAEHT